MTVHIYRYGGNADGFFSGLAEGDYAAANTATGWTVAKTASANSAEMRSQTKASGTFTAQGTTPKPASFITSSPGNAFKIPSALSGQIAATAWTFNFAVRATTASSQAGRVRLRIFKATNSTGTAGVVELTSTTLVGSTTAALSTTADQTSTVTWNPGTTFTLNNEFLFFVVAWEITTASGSNSGDVVLRSGSSTVGSRITIPDLATIWTFPNTPLIDDFNRANETLGAPYVPSYVGQNTDVIISNRLQGNFAGNFGTCRSDVSAADAEIYFTIVQSQPQELDLYVRLTPGQGPTGYYCSIISNVCRINVQNASGSSPIGATGSTVAYNNGDKVGMQIIGSTITMVYQAGGTGPWIVVATATDTTYTAPGGIGWRIGSNIGLDDFGGGGLPATAAAGIDSNGVVTENASFIAQITGTDSGTIVETASVIARVSDSDLGFGMDVGGIYPVAGLVIRLDASSLVLANGADVNPWPNIASPGIPGNIVGSPNPTKQDNILNGNPVVRFFASQGRVRMTGTGATGDFTLLYVAHMNGSTPANWARIATATYPTANALWGWWGGYIDALFDGNWPGGVTASTPATTAWLMYSADKAAGQPTRLFKDGALIATTSGAGAGGQELQGTLNISGLYASTAEETSDCEVAELLLYNRVLSTAERQQAESYLRGKWLNLTPVGSDSGTITESATLVARISSADANGTTTENGSSFAAITPVSSSDTNGATTEFQALIAQLPSLDSGTVSETQSISIQNFVSSSDTGTITEATSLQAGAVVSGSDSGTASENAILKTTTAVSDSGVGTEISVVTAAVSAGDANASTTETAAIFSPLSSADSGTGSDGGIGATDDFNRADGSLGANWTKNVFDGNTVLISSNKAVPSGGTVNQATAQWTGTVFGSTQQFSQARITEVPTVANWVAVGVRIQASGGDWYRLLAFNNAGTHEYRLGKRVSNTNSQIGSSFFQTINVGDVIRLEVNGNNLTVKVNGVTAITATDSSIPSGGAPGIAFFTSANGFGGSLDDWSGGDIQAGATVTAQIPSTDTGTAASEAGVLVAKLIDTTVNATVTETASTGVPIQVLDSGVSSETAAVATAQIPTADTGTITENASVYAVYQFSSSDSGTTTETAANTKAILSATDSNGTTLEIASNAQFYQVSGSDSGTASESVTVTAKVAGTDSNSTTTENGAVFVTLQPVSSADFNGTTTETLSLGLIAVEQAVPGSTFTPSQITGLGIWFDASQLALADGASVDPWPNIANAAVPGVMVGSPAPTIRANALNGLPVVRFAVDLARLRIQSGSGITTDWTVAYVGRKYDLANATGRIVSGINPPNNILVGYWDNFQDAAYDNGFTTPDVKVAVTTDWKLYSADGLTAATRMRIFSNGVLLGSTLTAQGWGGTFAINGYNPTDTSEACDCEVAEIVMYNRQLSGVERQQVEGYLRTKWITAQVPSSLPVVTEIVSVVAFNRISDSDSTSVITESASVKASYSTSDSGTIFEFGSLAGQGVFSNDALGASESAQIALGASDQGVGSESASQRFSGASSDTGTVTETQFLAVKLATSDSGSSQEAQSFTYLLYASDIGTVSENTFLGLLTTDGGTTTETASRLATDSGIRIPVLFSASFDPTDLLSAGAEIPGLLTVEEIESAVLLSTETTAELLSAEKENGKPELLSVAW